MLKNKQIIFSLIGLLVLTALLCGGCQSRLKGYERSFFAMDTVIKLIVYAPNEELAITGFNAAEDELRRIERLTTRYTPLGEAAPPPGSIEDINAKAGTWVKVDDELFALLALALEWSEKTGGAFDITLGNIMALWDFTGAGHIPEPAVLQAALAQAGWEKVQLKTETKEVYIPTGLSLDLGAIAKGYGAEKMAKVIKEVGITYALIDAGGNI